MKKKKNEKLTEEELIDNEEQDDQLEEQKDNEAQTEIDTLTAERDEYLEMARRVQADLENYRRRNATLRTDSILDGKSDILIEMLPVIDNFERALLQAEAHKQDKGFMEGIEMIYRQLLSILEKNDVEMIEGVGELLDPTTQQAVIQEASEEIESGCVIEVLQRGYRIKDGRVLRYGMVKVAE